jgi:hypothetical protein
VIFPTSRPAIDGCTTSQAESLFVGRQNGYRRRLLVRAGLDHLRPRLLLDLPPNFGRLAESRLDDDRLALLDVLETGHDTRSQFRPELVDLGRHIEVVADDRAAFLDVEILHVDRDIGGAQALDGFALHERREVVVRLFDEHPHVRRREILSAQLLGDPVDLVQAHLGMTRGRSSGHELPDVLFNVVERRPVLASRPDVRKLFGQLLQRTGHAGGVAAGDDDGAFLSERFSHHLDQTFAGLERRPRPFLVGDQPVDERMRGADEDEDRLAVGRRDRLRRLRDRQRDAGGFESQPRGEIDDAGRCVAGFVAGAEDDVDAIGNQVVVGIAERAFVRVERGCAASVTVAAARGRSTAKTPAPGECRRMRSVRTIA